MPKGSRHDMKNHDATAEENKTDPAGASRRSVLTAGTVTALTAAAVTGIGASLAATARRSGKTGTRIPMAPGVEKLVLAEASAPRYAYGPQSADLAAGLAGLISGYATEAAGIRNARLVTFATAGHGVYVDEADRFNAELLRFVIDQPIHQNQGPS
jgi:hypothetical protein